MNQHGLLRFRTLQHYSQSIIPFCACCHETILEFLTIDHINNDGAEQRKQLRGRGRTILLWIKRNDYPPGFQVLCMNCNHAKGSYGVCPHERLKQCL